MSTNCLYHKNEHFSLSQFLNIWEAWQSKDIIVKRQALSNIGVAHIEGMVPKAGGLLAIGPQHGEDPLDNQPDGVEEEAGDQREDHLEGYFPRCQEGQCNMWNDTHLSVPVLVNHVTPNNDHAANIGTIREIWNFQRTYGSVSAGREKWPFNVLFFLKVEPPCDQT